MADFNSLKASSDSLKSVFISHSSADHELAPKLGMKLPTSSPLCEQGVNPICKQASSRTGDDWCSIIASMPRKLTYAWGNSGSSPIYDIDLLYVLNIERNKIYYLGIAEFIGLEYFLVEVSKDASSWTVLRFMEPEGGMGRCKKDDDGHQADWCWRKIPLHRVAGTDQMRFEDWERRGKSRAIPARLLAQSSQEHFHSFCDAPKRSLKG